MEGKESPCSGAAILLWFHFESLMVKYTPQVSFAVKSVLLWNLINHHHLGHLWQGARNESSLSQGNV